MKTVILKLVGLALMLVGIIFVPYPARIAPVIFGAIILNINSFRKREKQNEGN